LNLINTVSLDGGHGLFEIVQTNVYEFPARPVKVEVGLDGLDNEPPVPLTILQLPVPIVGVLAASVKVVILQVVEQSENPLSGPASAVVGGGVIITVVEQLTVLLHASETVQLIVEVPILNKPLAFPPDPLLVVAPVMM
jgi:hypothetical protein